LEEKMAETSGSGAAGVRSAKKNAKKVKPKAQKPKARSPAKDYTISLEEEERRNAAERKAQRAREQKLLPEIEQNFQRNLAAAEAAKQGLETSATNPMAPSYSMMSPGEMDVYMAEQRLAEANKNRLYRQNWPGKLPEEIIDEPPGQFAELETIDYIPPLPIRRHDPTLSEMLSNPEDTFSLLQIINEQFFSPYGLSITAVPVDTAAQSPEIMSSGNLAPLTAAPNLGAAMPPNLSQTRVPGVDVRDRAKEIPLLSRYFGKDARSDYYAPFGSQRGIGKGNIVRSGIKDTDGYIPVVTKRF